MPMSEELLKVKLAPVAGQMFGTFSEGQPIAEGIGLVFAIQVDGKEGERLRRFGRVSGAHDILFNIDNKKGVDEQVLRTIIFFFEAPPLEIEWRLTAVAVAEIAGE
jgi:hypothetical protein